jgi:hypothetical protein
LEAIHAAENVLVDVEREHPFELAIRSQRELEDELAAMAERTD